jgi:hypothetical protein
MTTATCHKCCGSKKINAFSHIAGGDCFACHGTAVIRVRESVVSEADQAALKAVAADTAAKRTWLLTATRESISRLTESQLFKARNFASACVACGESELDGILEIIKRRIELLVD